MTAAANGPSRGLVCESRVTVELGRSTNRTDVPGDRRRRGLATGAWESERRLGDVSGEAETSMTFEFEPHSNG